MKRLTLICLMLTVFGWSKEWDGAGYAHYSAPQKKTGFGVVSRLDCKEAAAILDVGCGDGGITALIAKRFTSATVTGIDLSSSMIDYAKTAHKEIDNLSFAEGDVTKLEDIESYDLIVSFAALHWVKEQEEALSRMARALKPEGKILIQIPLELPAPFQSSLNELLSRSEWEEKFRGFEPPWTFYRLGQYQFYLYDAGLEVSNMTVFVSDETYASQFVFQETVRQWLPYLVPLDPALKEAFLSQLIDLYITKLPPDENGIVHFNVPRLEIECIKLKY